jgi:hypothetical protein
MMRGAAKGSGRVREIFGSLWERRMLKSLVLFTACLGGSLLVGMTIAFLLMAVGVNEDVSIAIATGIWILGGLTAMMFGSVYVSNTANSASLFVEPSRSTLWRQEHADRKMQSAELRVGLAYAMCVGCVAQAAQAPVWAIVALAIAFGLLGGWIGHQVKLLDRARKEKLAQRQLPQ